jgi:ABC-type transport system involved in cytochrome bd biosynthesis fused ATPase/permease subunit
VTDPSQRQVVCGALIFAIVIVLSFVNWHAAVIVLLTVIMIGIGNLQR